MFLYDGSVPDPLRFRAGTSRTRTKREPPLIGKREPYAVALGKNLILHEPESDSYIVVASGGRRRSAAASAPPRSARSVGGGLGSASVGSVGRRRPRLRLGRLGRLGSARLGSARLGSARLGSVRLGSAQLGSAQLGSSYLIDLDFSANLSHALCFAQNRPTLGIWGKKVLTCAHTNCTFGNREND